MNILHLWAFIEDFMEAYCGTGQLTVILPQRVHETLPTCIINKVYLGIFRVALFRWEHTPFSAVINSYDESLMDKDRLRNWCFSKVWPSTFRYVVSLSYGGKCTETRLVHTRTHSEFSSLDLSWLLYWTKSPVVVHSGDGKYCVVGFGCLIRLRSTRDDHRITLTNWECLSKLFFNIRNHLEVDRDGWTRRRSRAPKRLDNNSPFLEWAMVRWILLG